MTRINRMTTTKWARPFFAAAALAIASATAAFAQAEYPNKPVRLILGFPAGSAADVSARVVANRMGQILGQQIVVETKPGAAAAIAADYVAHAPKDGYTLFQINSAVLTNTIINPKLAFDIARDFAPVALMNTVAVALVVPPAIGVNSVQELIALAKSKPGEVLYASTGVGTAPHLAGELFAMRAGLSLVHVPYTGSPQAVTDLLAGRVTMMFSPASSVMGQAAAGKLKLLASATSKRPAALPDAPTMAEAGMPDFDTSIWFGLAVPAGTPRPVIDKLAAAVREASKADDVLKALHAQGMDPLEGGPEELAAHIASETKRWTEVATAAGLRK
jgi:tripartite-type tricarboxylate transporter receptor subunit TctC